MKVPVVQAECFELDLCTTENFRIIQSHLTMNYWLDQAMLAYYSSNVI